MPDHEALPGVPDATATTYPFTTADGLALSLLRIRRDTAPGDPVLLIHGLTTSSDMFVMPEHRNLATCLLDEGHDVWCLDSRMSMRHPYNATPHRWTLDDCALHDHPRAVQVVREHTGGRPLHVVAHCIGALTFAMAMASRQVTGIASAVLNSVALTPRVPAWSAMKLALGPTLFPLAGIEVLDPAWGARTASWRGRLLSRAVSAVHRECDVPACHLLSMMWGSGWPAMYEHANLDDRTHDRVTELFGPTGLHYYRHIHQMVRAGAAVKYRPHRAEHAALPDDYLAHADVGTDLLLTTGSHNRVFTDSNVVLHDRLRDRGERRHELRVFTGYGHQDVFMGRDSARDVFGHLLEFLTRPR